jgi:hypothetical protein
MQQLRVDVEYDNDRVGRESPALVRLMRRDCDVWRPVMVEVCYGSGPRSAYQHACDRADEIRVALGLLRTFIVRSSALSTEIDALDAGDAILRVLRADEHLFRGQEAITVTAKQEG